MLACIVSLKIFLVLTIFYAPAVSEWNEKIIVLIHRLFVLVVGFGTGGLICQAGGAMCRQAPLKLYLLNANNGAIPDYKGSLLTNLTMFAFVSVIIVCQILIETKRYFIIKEEKKADKLAAAAFKQIQTANLRLDSRGLQQLGVQFPPRLAWQEIVEIPIPAEITNMQTQNSDNTTKAMALKISRYVSIFGILPTIFSIIASSVEHINSFHYNN